MSPATTGSGLPNDSANSEANVRLAQQRRIVGRQADFGLRGNAERSFALREHDRSGHDGDRFDSRNVPVAAAAEQGEAARQEQRFSFHGFFGCDFVCRKCTAFPGKTDGIKEKTLRLSSQGPFVSDVSFGFIAGGQPVPRPLRSTCAFRMCSPPRRSVRPASSRAS